MGKTFCLRFDHAVALQKEFVQQLIGKGWKRVDDLASLDGHVEEQDTARSIRTEPGPGMETSDNADAAEAMCLTVQRDCNASSCGGFETGHVSCNILHYWVAKRFVEI